MCLLFITDLLQLVVPNVDTGKQNETQQQQQTATEDADQQSSVPHINTASGLKYAVSDKAKDKSGTIKEDQEVCN